jgi:hypothetical protein
MTRVLKLAVGLSLASILLLLADRAFASAESSAMFAAGLLSPATLIVACESLRALQPNRSAHERRCAGLALLLLLLPVAVALLYARSLGMVLPWEVPPPR